MGTLVGLVVLGPALAPGYTLHYDLVFVPDLPLSARTLGTDGSVPRAVPNDLVVALLGTVLPGWLVHKLVLLGCFVVGGAGAGALARTLPGAAAGAVLLTWNPWVGERLGIGHWGYLIGYAVLPWVLVAATGPRSPRRRALLVAALTVAALGGSTPGVIATLLAAVAVLVADGSLRERAHSLALVVGVALLANAAWWWPFLRTASRAADPGGATAFAAAADTPFGILGSLVLGGGLWNDRTWFVERSAWPASAAALVAVVVVLGLSWSRREWWRDPRTRAATVAGVVGLVLAALAALPGGGPCSRRSSPGCPVAACCATGRSSPRCGLCSSSWPSPTSSTGWPASRCPCPCSSSRSRGRWPRSLRSPGGTRGRGGASSTRPSCAT
ncbi:hypothetical protein ON003_02310 [Janibacter hoylei]|uniref:hypothetical protein n=1 Tax=Janibacter hoylei TaxID=364298 RepID=UPI0022378553|nr:hypothetical protein [Janibacter hoylei]MCW4600567.1 hypothetical protein [Janibacter hoylei]